jgi:hypothetical protein
MGLSVCPYKSFMCSPIFDSKAGACPCGAPSMCPLLGWAPGFAPNIRQGWKDMPGVNALTYLCGDKSKEENSFRIFRKTTAAAKIRIFSYFLVP